jgi:hypothetical protein
MNRWLVFSVLGFLSCRSALPPDVLAIYEKESLYTCCNLHFYNGVYSDANFHVGAMLPLGTKVRLVDAGRHSVTIDAEGLTLTISQDYGRDQESFDHFLKRILVVDDPRPRVEALSPSARETIRQGRVAKGMTKDQVILSLGPPPIHRTLSTEGGDWVYCYNKWLAYQVVFDDHGLVIDVPGWKEGMKEMGSGPVAGEEVRQDK